MKAGRELDVLVAERVMGIKSNGIYYGDWDTKKEYPYYIPSGKPRRTHAIDEKPLPYYSTYIGDAWQVVEVFRQGRFRRPDGNPGVACCVDLHVTDAPEINGDCFCSIYGPMTAKVEAQAQEMSLAICLAALKAVGWTVEGK